MALVTTPGGISSNSFITVVEADSYLATATLFDTTPWTSLNEAQKEERLIHAALIMKTRFTWIGWPVYKRQALPFPRRMPDSESLDEAAVPIPEPIKQAQAFIALDIVHRGSVGLTPASHGKAKPYLKRLSLFGSLDVTLTDTPRTTSDPSALGRAIASAHWIVEQLLAPYLTTIQFINATSTDDAPELLDEVL